MAAQPVTKNITWLAPQPATRPRGPPIKIRRYGQNDFEKFDEENARGSHLCVGSAEVRKVNIECKYHWQRSQWGVLGPNRSPAGIVYMDIAFHQPHGYWLESAAVYITMGEDALSTFALAKPRRPAGAGGDSSEASEHAVQISEYFGPKYLIGGKTSRNETKTTKLEPAVDVAGAAKVGGVGHTFSSSQERTAHWVFRGDVYTPAGRAGLRTLKWELIENKFDPGQPHNNEYRTAFAFEHSRRPVYMRVEVEGKLKSKKERILHNVLRFSSKIGRKGDSTLTYLDFSKGPESRKRLDDLARGLKSAMEMENYNAVPIEIPNSAPVRFFPDDGQSEARHRPIENPGGRDIVQGRESEVDALLQGLRSHLDDEPTRSLAWHLGLSEPKEHTEASATDDDMDARTLVNSESTASTPSPDRQHKAQADGLEEMLKNPAIKVFLNLILSMNQLFTLAKLFMLARWVPVSEPLQGKQDDAKTWNRQRPGFPQPLAKLPNLGPGLLSPSPDPVGHPLLGESGPGQTGLYRTASEEHLSRSVTAGRPLPRPKDRA